MAEKVHYCTYYECCDPRQIIYDVDGLKADLQSRLFGQHIVNATLIPALRAHIRNLHRSEKPLVMSFHGLIGTGKNFVTERIIKHFYQKGDHSRFVHKYMARKDFPLASEVDTYRVSFDILHGVCPSVEVLLKMFTAYGLSEIEWNWLKKTENF